VYLPLTKNVPPEHVFSFFLAISNLTPECDALKCSCSAHSNSPDPIFSF
jgi:hypothetical protein